MMKHEELVAVMNDFKASRGWQEIQEWLAPIIKQAEVRLLGDEVMTESEQRDLKRSWKLHKKFYDFPDFIVAKSAAGITPEKPNADPYDE